jgi:hypothetical protein
LGTFPPKFWKIAAAWLLLLFLLRIENLVFPPGWKLGLIRDDRFCHQSNLFMVSGVSPAAGRERPVKSKKKLMNIEHRTSNIERRIMYSVYFIKD